MPIWKRRTPTPPLPPLPDSSVRKLEREVEEARGFLRRLNITMDFALDERKFAEMGPKDIDKLMES